MSEEVFGNNLRLKTEQDLSSDRRQLLGVLGEEPKLAIYLVAQ
jgi:hypothetical protein